MLGIKVSIVIICYNNFEYIYRTIDSVLAQKYDEIELVVSDDGSEVFDANAVKKYIEKHKKKNIVNTFINQNQKNMGTVAHLDKIYRQCTGKLLTVIAADDAYADGLAISSLVDGYVRYGGKARVITSLLAMCDHTLKKIKSVFTSPKDVEMINRGDSRELFEELAWRCIMPSSGTLVEKEVYNEIGSLTDKYDLVEDWSSHLIIARMGIPVRCVDRITVLHRDGGVSHGNVKGAKSVYLRYYKDLLSLYEYEVAPYADMMSEEAAARAKKYYDGRCYRYKSDLNEYERYGYKKIVFYFRKGINAKGDFTMYYRIASYIAENYDYAVYCINNSVPELQYKYQDSKIIFGTINKNNLSDFADATFITAYNQLFFLLEEISELKNAKILLLFLHPQMVKWMEYQTFGRLFKTKDTLEFLKKNNAYAFMDEANKLAAERAYGGRLPDRFLPVVADKSTLIKKRPIIDASVGRDINVVWLGRLDYDKVYSLINFVTNLCDYAGEAKINVHLIGDGNGVNLLASEAEKTAPIVRYIYNSYLYGEERDEYLIKHADFVVAMGISALDSALLGLPTIMPIVSPSRFRDDKYMYIFDTTNFCLGFSVEDLKNPKFEKHSAKDIIEDIYVKEKKAELGKKCYEFVRKEFSVESNIEGILSIINNTGLTVADCKKCDGIRRQFNLFRVYRKIRPGRKYADFIKFRNKIYKMKTMSFGTIIKTIFTMVKKVVKGGVK